ncbi:uncharacterized protein LOC126845011 [Adelges cooleyi]|uniref:uncharacterized protein LOC126845011 n=1 Tax=Adelges cooleyi TaxID=133065 RepID=UPI00217F90FD|nr:uncharacterized protein LOC126845011 [Adelges cooleyi]
MSKHDLTDFQRLGVVNFYLPISKNSYNNYFFLNYAVESMFVMTIAVFLLSFDIFYFTICTAIAAQYETIISGLKKFGHNRINKTDGTQMYEELKIIISDYQNRDGVNFGLYSCDWTAMDIRFKKLLILAMAMNNANQLKIKATPNRAIDLQLFLGVIRTSYTIVSFMVNVELSSSDNVN